MAASHAERGDCVDSSGHDRGRPSYPRGVGCRLRRARAPPVREGGTGRRPGSRRHRQDACLRPGRAHGCGRDPSSLRGRQGCSRRGDSHRHRGRPLRSTGGGGRALGAHALGAAAYAARAVELAHPDDPDARAAEVRRQLAQLSPEAAAALRSVPPLGTDPSGPLGRGLLSSGPLGEVIRELQAHLSSFD
mgnify:CR=1 FL=1